MFVSKYSVEDKKRWMEEFKSSGKSAQAYAREIGLPPTTIRFWLEQELNKNHKSSNKNSSNTLSDNSFGAIKIIGDETTCNMNNTSNLIKFYGCKIKIELEKGFDKEFLKKVVEVLVNDR